MSSVTRWKRWAGGAGLVASGVLAGGILAGTLSANADEGATTSGTESSTSGRSDSSQPQRSDEELLTGDTKTQVEDAVLDEYPDATIERTETDSGGVYESHIITADGEHLTVLVGEDFAVIGTDAGGPGGHGGRGGGEPDETTED